MEELYIESMDDEARGVGSPDGVPVHVDGALPGERVRVRIERSRRSHAVAGLAEVLLPSAQRVTPRCPHFGVCGGCVMQHLDPAAQVAVKQRLLEDTFQRIGRLRPPRILAPVHGPSWGYRYRARLSVRLVPAKGGILLGFHERHSSYVADLRVCHILPSQVSALLLPLKALIAKLSIPDRVPQIEVAVGDDGVVVLALRHLLPLSDADRALLRSFAAQHGVHWWLQPHGPDSVEPLEPGDAHRPAYFLPDYGLRMAYRPTDFTQVNPQINRVLVAKALALLEPGPDDRIADLFCGLGNFTLPLAGGAREVLGVEGSPALIERARQAAQSHGLEDRARFLAQNLFAVDAAWLRAQGRFDRVLIDPPREGAQAVALALAQLDSAERPRRIVYVSCRPASLARDAAILVHQGGYRLVAAGIVNMFPHTAHVESIAVFESGKTL